MADGPQPPRPPLQLQQHEQHHKSLIQVFKNIFLSCVSVYNKKNYPTYNFLNFLFRSVKTDTINFFHNFIY